MRVPFLLLTLLFLPVATAQWWNVDTAQEAPTGQLRGIWVDAYGPGFKTPAEIDALIADAQAMNLNALFVQAVRRGDCYCLRSALPVADDPTLALGFDPLETLIERAHAADLQVHAWVVTLALWGADTPPTDPAHVYNLHGPGAGEADSWLSRRYDGVTRPEGDVYLDPGVPAVADYLTEVVVSLVQNYGFDGVSFDRLRYPDYNDGAVPSWGYNPVSLERFARETGGSALPHPTDEGWTAWRREQLSLLQRRLYLAAKQADPTLWVGAATIVYGAPPQDFADSHAYRVVLQDWAGWLRSGFLDLNLPMNYKRNADSEAAGWFDAWNRYALTLGGGAATAVATGVYLNDPEGTRTQAAAVVGEAQLAGWVGYSYRTPSDGVEEGGLEPQAVRDELAALLTAPGEPFAVVRDFSRPPPVTALSGRAQADGVQTVELLKAGEVVATAQTDAGGHYGFVLDEPEATGDYLLRLRGGVAMPAPVQEGRVARAPTLTKTWYAAEGGGLDGGVDGGVSSSLDDRVTGD